MKYSTKEMYFYSLIIWINMFYVSTAEYDSIINLISSNQSVCNGDKFFGKFSLSNIMQFGAMCNIAVPKQNQVNFLINNNVGPILCMGMYDVSLRSCRAAIDNSLFSDIFPPTVDKFNKVFDLLERNANFSSLATFCQQTVKRYIINDSASNTTDFWWKTLNTELKDVKKCTSLCRTNGEKIHPLCAYIIWLNAVFINNQKSLAESVDLGAFTNNIIESNNSNPEIEDEVYTKVPVDASPLPKIDLSENPGNEVDGPYNGKIPPIKAASSSTNVSTDINEKKPANDSNNDNPLPTQDSPSETTNKVEYIMDKNYDIKPQRNTSETTIKNLTTIGQYIENPPKNGIPNRDFEGADGAIEEEPVQNENIPISGEEGDGDDVEMPPEGSPKINAEKNPGIDKGDSNKPDTLSKDIESDKVYGNEDVLMEDHFIEAEDSHFFTYFLCLTVLVVLFYLAFYNKKKLVALAVEGRRTKGSRRRPNCSNYSKLNCSLEEALVSNTTASVTHVLY